MLRVLSLSLGLITIITASVAGQSAESSLVPTRVLFAEDFELGDLEDAALPRIERIEEYLSQAWRPQLEEYPRFMTPVLERVPGVLGPRGRRYLRYPVRSGDAAIRSPSFSLRPFMRLRATADLKWRGIGRGALRVGILYSTGERVSFVSGEGADSDWRTMTGEGVVPAEVTFGQVEVWIEGDHTRNEGEHGIDNLRIEILPRVVLRSARALRRMDPVDDTPFIIESIGFPRGDYDLDIVFKNRQGDVVHRVDHHKFVRVDRQIDFRPRLRWADYGLPRGLYTVEVFVRSEQGWGLGDRGSFVLGGKPLFAHSGTPGRWGLSLPPLDSPPSWIQGMGPIRYLVEWQPGSPAQLPEWLQRVGAHRRSITLDPDSDWSAEAVEALLPLRHHFSSWYWTGDAKAGDPILTQIAGDAPYLRAGQRVIAGEMSSLGERRALLDVSASMDDPRQLADARFERASFDVWIAGRTLLESDDPASTLATFLYLSAIHRPQTVFLDDAEALFLETVRDHELVPQPAMLAWEFVTGFLSGATFQEFVAFDPEAILVAFERDSKPYLVAMSRGQTGEIDLFAEGQVSSYGAVGNATEYLAGEDGRVRIPLSAEPVLLDGIDLRKVRTVGSLRIKRRSGVGRASGVLPLEVSLTNRYAKTVRATLDLRYPPDWPGLPQFPERSLEAGEEMRWPLDVTLPRWFGADDRRDLSGDVILEFGDRTERIPVSLDFPVEHDQLAVTFDESPGKLLTVTVANKGGEDLRVTVFLEVEPIGRHRRFATQTLAATESDRFSIAIDERPEGSSLFVGVVVEATGEHVNRVFPLD